MERFRSSEFLCLFLLFVSFFSFPFAVSAVYAIMVICIALASIPQGIINLENPNDSTNAARVKFFFLFCFLPLPYYPKATTTPVTQVAAGPAPGGLIAAGFFMTIGVMAFPGAFLAFNMADVAPNKDDSLVTAKVLIHLRFMFGFSLFFYAHKLTATLIQLFTITTYGGVAAFIEAALVAIAVILAFLLTFFAFKRHTPPPFDAPPSNKLMILSLLMNGGGFVLVMTAAILYVTIFIDVIAETEFWLVSLEISRGATLVVLFPLLLKFKNDAGEFFKVNLVLCIVSLGLIALSCVTYFALNMVALLNPLTYAYEAYVTIFILTLIGYMVLLGGAVLAFIQALRLRKKYRNLKYVWVGEESPILENVVGSPPKYVSDDSYYPPLNNLQGPPSYQQPADVAPADAAYPAPIVYQRGAELGDFDYDKPQPE
jgi:hypothetical protein